MSLALEFLAAYFEQPATTKADFAKSAGVDPSLISQLLVGAVQISTKNLPRLLNGFRTDLERREFLAAHLRDQVPVEFADDVIVHQTSAILNEAAEGDAAFKLEVHLVEAFGALPSEAYRRRVVRFLHHLRKDSALRDIFRRTMDYIDESSSETLVAGTGTTDMASTLLQAGKEQLAAKDQSAKPPAARK